MSNQPLNPFFRWCGQSFALSLLALVITWGMPTAARSFQFEYGELKGSLDTTLSYGLSWRVQDRDKEILGVAGTPKSGSAFSVNADDGNQNYDQGIISNVGKITSELELNYLNFGGFIRGSAFYDYENEEGRREKAPLSGEALDLVGSDVRLLDAYLSANFDLGTMPATVRIGEQVVSWGESTFIQNSINTINPVDVSAIRLPGAELREALLPEGMVYGSLGVTGNTTLEGFYLYDWDRTDIDPPGSYFSTTDFAGDGGERVMLGFGGVPDTVAFDQVIAGSTQVVKRGPDRNPEDDGQYGLALRLFVPELNDTEFGFFFINYHSRLPIVNAHTGTAAAAAGVDPNGLTYVQSARYFLSYPEDIQLYGISFNTQLAATGIALQGEVSYRRDAPLQIDDIELLFAALGAPDNLSPGNTPVAALARFGQLGLVPLDSDISGFIERDVVQYQATATKVFGPTFGANTAALVGEVALSHVNGMPDKDELRLEGPGTFISGNAALAAIHGPGAGQFESSSHFADATSWGYRLLGQLVYNNAIGAVNLIPRLAWQHDVNGISPGPGGNFIENRKAITFGLNATYLNSWEADLSYTNFFGAGRYNLINDRDIVSASIKYSF